ncbi:MAG: hypothetical protein AAF802_18000, partial [Planctomycetota bacterium]
YVRCEQMTDLGGGIRMDENGFIINETDHEILDAMLVQKQSDGFKASTIGMLGVGEGKEVLWGETEASIAGDLPMQTNVVLKELTNERNLPEGSVRLVGRIEESLPGIEILPSASQQTSQTIVLAHLEYPAPREPERDSNLITDFRRVNRDAGESSQSESSQAGSEDKPDDQTTESDSTNDNAS